MKNIDIYEKSVREAVNAYQDEMARLTDKGIPDDGCCFEDWLEREADSTAKLIAAEEARKAAVRAEREAEVKAIKDGVERLKAIYRGAGWDEADRILGEISDLAPRMDIFDEVPHAADCFHSGALQIMEDDVRYVIDDYDALKTDPILKSWNNPAEWFAVMEKITDDIKGFIREGGKVLASLRAEKANG